MKDMIFSRNKILLGLIIFLTTSSCFAKPIFGNQRLFIAIKINSINQVRYLLDQGIDPNIRNINTITPLILAAYNGKLEIAELLLDRGADVNASNIYGETPLLVAVAKGNVDTVKLLLKRGADPYRLIRERSVLSVAKLYRKISILPSTKARYDKIIQILEEAEKTNEVQVAPE